MLVHGTEKGSMACLENPGTEGTAQIGDLPVSKSCKIRDGKFHSCWTLPRENCGPST